MDSSIRAEKIKPLHMRCSWTRHRWRCAHRHFFILPCLTTSYWCITNTLGKSWKMAVDQNPGADCPSLRTKMTRPCAFIILLSSFHPPSSPFVIDPSLFGEKICGASHAEPATNHHGGATIVVFHEKRAHVQDHQHSSHQHPCREVIGGEPGLLGWSYRTYIYIRYIVENKIH